MAGTHDRRMWRVCGMSILARLNDLGIHMTEDGRYIATLEQLERLVHDAKKSATCAVGLSAGTGGRRAYEYLCAHGCTQQEAADAVGVSQVTLSRYIKRHGLKVVDHRRKADAQR